MLGALGLERGGVLERGDCPVTSERAGVPAGRAGRAAPGYKGSRVRPVSRWSTSRTMFCSLAGERDGRVGLNQEGRGQSRK
jgi:hypothetical protein